jgi:hypothetical protein
MIRDIMAHSISSNYAARHKRLSVFLIALAIVTPVLLVLIQSDESPTTSAEASIASASSGDQAGGPTLFTNGDGIAHIGSLLSEAFDIGIGKSDDYSYHFAANDARGEIGSSIIQDAPEVNEGQSNNCVPSSGIQDSFFTSQNAELYLNDERARIIGGNSYGIFSEYLGAGHVTNLVPDSLQRFIDARSNQLRIMRFWLDIAPSDYWFDQAYGVYNSTPDHSEFFSALDNLIADAKANGIYLVPVFVSAYDQWTKQGNYTNFWYVGSETNLLFKDWVDSIVVHYRDETQIAWWELGNEPNYFNTVGLSIASEEQVITWAQDMASFIRARDSNHLIEGGYNNIGSLDMSRFDALNEFLDIASHHIYDEDLYALEAGKGITDKRAAINDYVQLFTDRAKNVLGIPILWGEFGGDLNAEPENPFQGWFMEAVYNHDSDVALVWSWEEGFASDPYVVSPTYRPHVAINLTHWGDKMATVFHGPTPAFPEPDSLDGEPIYLWWDVLVDLGFRKWGNPDPYFLAAIVKKESWFDALLYNAEEKAAYENGDPVWYGEYYGKGLFQLTGPWIAGVPKPSTFEWEYNMPPEANYDDSPVMIDAYNGTQNIDRGSWYMKALHDHYDGDLYKIGSAYRYGWQPVDAFLQGEPGQDPYNNEYIIEVMNFRAEYLDNVGLTEEELQELIDSASQKGDLCPPAIEDVRLNGIQGPLLVDLGTLVEVTARLNDTLLGNSNITGANYTIGQANWPSSKPMNPIDGSFDTPVEEVTNAPALIDTSLLGTGTYQICVYGSDEENNNLTGSCQTLIVTFILETIEPMVLGFNINGQTELTVYMSSSSDLELQAYIDDTGRGESSIAGANYTIDGDWAGAQPMSPEDGAFDDGAFDESNESVVRSVPIPSIPGVFSYCVYGWDEWNNGNSTGQCALVTVIDDVPPVVSSILADPDPQITGGIVYFEAVVTDNVEVSSAWIEIIDPIGNVLGNYSMTYDASSGNWKYNSSFVDLGRYTYTVRANDTSDNWADSTGNFDIIETPDTTPPTIVSIADSPDPQFQGGIVYFEAVVTDNVAVEEVRIEIFNPIGNLNGNFSMTYDAVSGKWKYNSSFNDIGIHTYIVHAKDTSDNWASESSTFEIVEPPDTTPPTIMSISDSPDPQVKGGIVDFEAVVSDDEGVDSVWIEIFNPSGNSLGSFPMTYDAPSGKWIYSSPFNNLGVHTYTVTAIDTSGNSASESGTFKIIKQPDTTPPAITSIEDYPDPQIQGGTVYFEAIVTDNEDVEEVRIEIFNPIGNLNGNFSMTYDPASGKWKYNSSFNDVGIHTYIVHAKDTSDNWALESGTFEIVKPPDTTPPTIMSISDSPDPQSQGGVVDFEAVVTDDEGVSEVSIEIFDPSGNSLGNHPMTFDAPSGKWLYSSSFSDLGIHTYTVTAIDTSGNSASDSGSFEIIEPPDTTPPTIVSIADSPDPQVQGGIVYFEAVVTDDEGVEDVRIQIFNPIGNLNGNFSMTYDPASGKWLYNSSFMDIGVHTYFIHAKDTSGNWANESGTFEIVKPPDTTPPVISSVSDSPDPQVQGGIVNFEAVVTDDEGVDSVSIEIFDPSGSSLGISPMTYFPAVDKWRYSSSFNDLGLHSYKVTAIDTSGNPAVSWGNFEIVKVPDTTPPVISSVMDSPDPQFQGGIVDFEAVVTDNEGVKEVRIQIRDPNGFIKGDFPMTYDAASGKWRYSSPFVDLGVYTYTILAWDTSDNLATELGSFEIIKIPDTTPPVISGVTDSPDPQTSGGTVSFEAIVEDNEGVAEVRIQIRDPNGLIMGDFPMTYDASSGKWKYSSAFDDLGIYTYTVIARDSSDNLATETGSFEIIKAPDTTPPTISCVVDLPDPQISGGTVDFEAVVTDNEGVSEVTIEITNPIGNVLGIYPMVLDAPSGTWKYSSAFVDLGMYTYTVVAKDTSENIASESGSFEIVKVPDTTPPIISSVAGSPDPQIVGDIVNFEATVTDDESVGEVTIEIIDPLGNVLGNYSMAFDAPNNKWIYSSAFMDTGTYDYIVHARDTSDNWASSSGTFQIITPPDTTPPVISSISDSPDPQISGGVVDFEAVVSDDVGVDNVQITITDPLGNNIGSFPMAFDAPSGKWRYSSSFSYLGTYTYTINAEDTSSNSASSSGSFEIIKAPDTTPPMISSIADSPDPQTSGGTVYFEAIVKDDEGLSGVSIEIFDPSGNSLGVSQMTFHGPTGKWMYNSAFTGAGTYTYTITAIDTSGNTASASGSFEITMIPDSIPPVILSIQDSPDPQEVGKAVEFSAKVSDDVGVDNVMLNIIDIGSYPMVYETASDSWVYGMAFSVANVYSYEVTAFDASSNSAVASGSVTILNVVVPDVMPPIVGFVTATPKPQFAGSGVLISAKITDDGNIASAHARIVDKNGNLMGNLSMEYNATNGKWEKTVVFSNAGEYPFVVWAIDEAGNSGSAPGTASVIEENSGGEVRGRIVDSSGVPISGATVELFDKDGSMVATYTTGHDGTYIFTGVPPGIYTIKVAKSGYETETIEEFSINQGEIDDLGSIILNPPLSIDDQSGTGDNLLWILVPVIALVAAVLILIALLYRRRKKKKESEIEYQYEYY